MSDSNSIIPFAYHEHQIRTVIRDGEPWFVATDVAKVLGMTATNATSSMVSSLDDDEKDTITLTNSDGGPARLIVSEAGLYRILMRSDKPEARPFQRWVTHDVLPSIRKTGKYDVNQPGQQTDWQTRQRYVTGVEVHDENWLVVERLTKIYPIFESGMSEQTKRMVSDFVVKSAMGGAKANPELESEITGENVIIVRSYLENRGVSQKQIKRYAGQFGIRVHQLYREEYGRDAPIKQKSMGAASRHGKLYVEKDRFILDRAFDEFIAAGKFAVK